MTSPFGDQEFPEGIFESKSVEPPLQNVVEVREVICTEVAVPVSLKSSRRICVAVPVLEKRIRRLAVDGIPLVTVMRDHTVLDGLTTGWVMVSGDQLVPSVLTSTSKRSVELVRLPPKERVRPEYPSVLIPEIVKLLGLAAVKKTLPPPLAPV